MDRYLNALSKYAVFSGRARRSEYWYFVLFNSLIGIFVAFIDMQLAINGVTKNLKTDDGGSVQILSSIYSLALFLPSLAVTIRRLHDIGKSAWWILISLVPIIGTIVLLVFTCTDSEYGENQYGANPKGSGF